MDSKKLSMLAFHLTDSVILVSFRLGRGVGCVFLALSDNKESPHLLASSVPDVEPSAPCTLSLSQTPSHYLRLQSHLLIVPLLHGL
jgi:hypothetical protein